MPDVLSGLTDVHRVAVLALRLRALDARSPQPILGDRASTAIADLLGLDLDTPRLPGVMVPVHAARTRQLDGIVRRFVAAHPDAVVVDVGCGFDPRATRCDPPSGVSWFGVDLPLVAELRRRFVPGIERVVGADVTDPGWLDPVPRDRPAVVVVEGLHALLGEREFADLVRAVTGHLAGGEIAFLNYGRSAMRNSRRARNSALYVASTRGEGVDDPREPEAWGAGLTLRQDLLRFDDRDLRLFPPALRAVTRVCQASARISRMGSWVLHYTFGPPG